MGQKKQEASLRATVEKALPEVSANIRKGLMDKLLFHQDAFAADYQDDEFVLLGKVIKYAGIYGIEVHVIGRNRETLTPAKGKRKRS